MAKTFPGVNHHESRVNHVQLVLSLHFFVTLPADNSRATKGPIEPPWSHGCNPNLVVGAKRQNFPIVHHLAWLEELLVDEIQSHNMWRLLGSKTKPCKCFRVVCETHAQHVLLTSWQTEMLEENVLVGKKHLTKMLEANPTTRVGVRGKLFSRWHPNQFDKSI